MTAVTAAATIAVWLPASAQAQGGLTTVAQNSGHSGAVRGIAVTADGRFYATGSFDQTIKVWRTSDGAEVRQIVASGSVRALAFTPDGQELVAGLEVSTPGGQFAGAVAVFEMLNSKLVGSVPIPYPVDNIAISHNGLQVAVASGLDGDVVAVGHLDAIRIKDLSTNMAISLTYHNRAVVFANDDASVIYGGYAIDAAGYHEGKLERRAVPTGYLMWNRTNSWTTDDLSLSPDGSTVALVGGAVTPAGLINGFVGLFSAANGGLSLRITSDHNIQSVTYSADGNRLLAGIYDSPGGILELNASTLSITRTIPTDNSVQNLRLIDSRAMIVTAEGQNSVQVEAFDYPTGNRVRSLSIKSSVTGISVSPADGSIAVAQGTQIILWNPTTGVSTALGVRDQLNNVSFSPDGTKVACAITNNDVTILAGGFVAVYRVSDGKELLFMQTPGSPGSVAWSPDSKTLVDAEAYQSLTAKTAGLVSVYSTTTGFPLSRISVGLPANAVLFAADGKTVVVAEGDVAANIGQLDIISTSTWKLSRAIATKTAANSLSFSPDGKYLATGEADFNYSQGSFSVVQVATLSNWSWKTNIVTTSPANCVAFSPDSSTLVIGQGSIDFLSGMPLGAVEFYNTANFGLMHHYTQGVGTGVNAVAFSAADNTLLMGRLDGCVSKDMMP